MLSYNSQRVDFFVSHFPQRLRKTLLMNQTFLSHLPVPRLRTWLPSAIGVRVVPDTRTASSDPPVQATYAAKERPSTVWSRGTLCAAVEG